LHRNADYAYTDRMEVVMKRRVEAVMSKFTDMIGPQTNKARALSAGEQQGQRAVVNTLKPTGVSADNTRAGHVSNASGLADAAKLASSLSRRSPVKARYGADNEYSLVRKADSDNRGTY
jgi:hypothetical protein